MPINVGKCIVCGGTQFSEVERCTCKPPAAVPVCTYVSCESCGLVFMNPMPTSAEMDKYYAKAYWQTHSADDKVSLAKQKDVAQSIKSYIEREMPAQTHGANLSILEIGSSFGVALNTVGTAIREKTGRVSLYAIEPSEHTVKVGQENYRDVEIIGKDVAALSKIDLTFDLIILSHVLEHFQDPVSALRLIAGRMHAGSSLFVEVPNFYGHPSVGYPHSFCFTEISLRNTLRASGLSAKKIDTLYRNKTVPLHLTCMAVKDANPQESEVERVPDVLRLRQAGKKVFALYTSAQSISNYRVVSFLWQFIPVAMRTKLKALVKNSVSAS